jgi:hypothetical protein
MTTRFRVRHRERAMSGLAAAGLFAALVAHLTLSVPASGDYAVDASVGGNNSAPGIQALLHGNFWGYLTHQPVVGLTSILLRLPFTALATPLGGGALLGYQLGALACLLPLALGGGWLVAAPDVPVKRRLLRLLAVLLVIESPILRDAIAAGHPEGPLAQVLAVSAVIAASKGRVRWAAVLLGVAVATKETAIIALPPVMLALPGRRREAGIVAGVTLALLSIAVVLDPAGFLRAVHWEGGARFVNPLSLLWPVASPVHLPGGQIAPARLIPLGLTRMRSDFLTLAAISIPTAVWYERARRRGARCNPLAMLALLGLMRDICDSTHLEYYYASALIATAAWEMMEDRIPLATALLTLTVSILFGAVASLSDTEVYLGSALGEILLVAYLARHAMPVPRSSVSTVAVPRVSAPLDAEPRELGFGKTLARAETEPVSP